ncbi:MAG: AAA family ATPase [Planctomycetales bacterium]|nr:AAA family ATPase [Planctomycetales bacterium]
MASFLLVGPEGIGKRYLAKVVAWQLYGNGGIERFDSAELTVASLVGTRAAKGDLLQAIERTPYTLILFERIDKAVPDVVNLVVQLLTTGKVYLPDSQTAVSFENATLVFTAEGMSSPLLASNSATNLTGLCPQALSELLTNDLEIDPSLLNAITEILPCKPPTDLVKAEVVALAMKQECSAHGLELSNVDPEILAAQVTLLDDASGFRLLPHRIKKLLRQPLVAASPQQHTSLSLRVRHR